MKDILHAFHLHVHKVRNLSDLHAAVSKHDIVDFVDRILRSHLNRMANIWW